MSAKGSQVKLNQTLQNVRNLASDRAILIGIGAVALAPIVLPAVAKIGKPILKAAIKTSLNLYEKSQGAVAEAGEMFWDVVAESKAEITAEAQQRLMNGKK
ncbi:MAG TPA: DUF5132 domain-containing protein [Cyanobacteria bacterium UBA11369]|nr:DUF5132 domain-containing protein [Cyanobacteria bacterium UBA11371]HBE30277.1 DUF5132 domain-containing protein [Cyanobacteria bacterium UBA11368]HBE54108.1 DUF5132 domain-containing protein [Cyanobacteria bacterium UBA11369]